jgi:hypothetical protein
MRYKFIPSVTTSVLFQKLMTISSLYEASLQQQRQQTINDLSAGKIFLYFAGRQNNMSLRFFTALWNINFRYRSKPWLSADKHWSFMTKRD